MASKGFECGELQPMAVTDLRCGDVVHRVGYFGLTHWIAEGAARESWPVAGEWHVPSLGTGCFVPFASPREVVMVCETGSCHSPLCGSQHRDR